MSKKVSIIEEKIEKKNLALKTHGFQINFYQTDDWLGNKPMYEATLIDMEEDEIEDTITGRYCDPSSVYDEILSSADERMELIGGIQ